MDGRVQEQRFRQKVTAALQAGSALGGDVRLHNRKAECVPRSNAGPGRALHLNGVDHEEPNLAVVLAYTVVTGPETLRHGQLPTLLISKRQLPLPGPLRVRAPASRGAGGMGGGALVNAFPAWLIGLPAASGCACGTGWTGSGDSGVSAALTAPRISRGCRARAFNIALGPTWPCVHFTPASIATSHPRMGMHIEPGVLGAHVLVHGAATAAHAPEGEYSRPCP